MVVDTGSRATTPSTIPPIDGSGVFGAFEDDMRAAGYAANGSLVVEDRPVPVPGENEILVAVGYCGICGTDVHAIREGWARAGAVLGHECAGWIAAVGPGVRGWSDGEAVAVEPSLACGTCELCRGGRPSLCRAHLAAMMDGSWPGAFAEYVRVNCRQVYRLPPALDLRTAALTEPLAVALHAITRSGFQRGETALVTGAGPLGCLCVAALRARGATRVIVSEPSAARRATALACGGDEVVRPEELEVPASPLVEVAAPVDVVLECSGNPAAFETGLAQLRPGGTLVIVGTGLARPALEHHRVLLRELVVTGAFNYDATGFADALELLSSGDLPLSGLLDPADVRLEDIMPTVEGLAAGRIARKVLVTPR
jgi:2-desacetyl-2-hydroxyethyl bacteriochlorophyllide A dehydrogenase